MKLIGNSTLSFDKNDDLYSNSEYKTITKNVLSYCHLQDCSTYYLFLFSDFIRPSRQIDIQSGLEFQYILRSRKHLCACPICFTLGDMSLVTVTDWSLSGPGSRPHLYPASQHFVSFMIRTELMEWKSS